MPILVPPAQYDVPPSIPVIERVLPANEVNRECRISFPEIPISTLIDGCAKVRDGKCYIIRVDRADVLRHELGHCNGWPRNHAGGYWNQARRDR